MIDKLKKAKERWIFDMVYGERDGLQIIDCESPDFLVCLANDLPKFGVEIAEFYFSESRARLEHIPGYIHDLVNGGEFRHKDDRRTLSVTKLRFTGPDNQLKYSALPGILAKAPSLEECAASVANMIRTKDIKLDTAFSRLSHVNLLLYDRENVLRPLTPSVFYSQYCVEVLREALFACRFREVFFVSRFSSGSAYVPLKMLVTIAEFFFFQAVLQTPQYRDSVDSVKVLMEMFTAYLSERAVSPTQLRQDDSGYEAIYGDTGIHLTNELSIQIRQYYDLPLPGDRRTILTEVAPWLSASFRKTLAAFRSDYTFSLDLAFPIHAPESPGMGDSKL
jgi:hypothetical protein